MTWWRGQTLTHGANYASPPSSGTIILRLLSHFQFWLPFSQRFPHCNHALIDNLLICATWNGFFSASCGFTVIVPCSSPRDGNDPGTVCLFPNGHLLQPTFTLMGKIRPFPLEQSSQLLALSAIQLCNILLLWRDDPPYGPADQSLFSPDGIIGEK